MHLHTRKFISLPPDYTLLKIARDFFSGALSVGHLASIH